MYAHSFQTVSRPGLSRMHHMLAQLGNPEQSLACIHVAGTNGKGSVCAFLSSMLRAQGCRVGVYTSPNLVRVNERMQINGAPVLDQEMAALFGALEPVAANTEAALGDRPTQFELWTAAAFLYFSQQHCDYVVLETGMGGSLDATNVIGGNVAAVLTRMALDHTEYLGDTLADIAAAKCGILKEACTLKTVFTAAQEPDCAAVIRQKAQELGLFVNTVPPLTTVGCQDFSQVCSVDGVPVTLGIGGIHQSENAALAVAVAQGLDVSQQAIRQGLAAARHPARLEVLRRQPLLLYDGAHNPNGAAALRASLDQCLGCKQKLTIIFACMHDKEIAPTLALLAPHAARWIFTTVQNNPRAESPEGLALRAREAGYEGVTAESLTAALAALDRDEPALVCGSLYLYADLPQDLLKGML